jgi:hypothetical protein
MSSRTIASGDLAQANSRSLVVALGVVASIAAGVLMAPETIRNVLANNTDYPAHLQITGQIIQQHKILLPHFLWAVSVIAVTLILPSVSLKTAAIITTLGYFVLTSAAVYTALLLLVSPSEKRTIVLCASATVCLMVVGPISIFTYPVVYFGYVVPNSYHNPTIVALKPFAIATFLATVALLRNPVTTRRLAIAGALASALATLAKPNYPLCIGPAAAIMAALRGPRRFITIAWVFLPTVGILAWQYSFHYAAVGASRLVIAPFFVFMCYGGGHSVAELVVRFLLSIAFPLAVCVFFPSAWQNVYIRLAWLSFGIAAFFTYFMAELTSSGLDCGGNFAWGTQITSFILFVAATAFFLTRIEKRDFGMPLNGSVGLFLIHLASGIVFYVRTVIRPWPP